MKAWQKAWGKAQFKDKTEMQLNQAYALPTTGAGRYKQFGIDSGSYTIIYYAMLCYNPMYHSII